MKYLLVSFFLVITAAFIISCGDTKEEAKPMDEEPATEMTNEEAPAEESVAETPAEETPATDEKMAEGGEKASTTAAGTKEDPLKVRVVSLRDIVVSKPGLVNSTEATELIGKGQLLGVKTGNKVYMVYNTDGSYAGKILAKFADKEIGIVGKMKVVKGINVIVADLIKPL